MDADVVCKWCGKHWIYIHRHTKINKKNVEDYIGKAIDRWFPVCSCCSIRNVAWKRGYKVLRI